MSANDPRVEFRPSRETKHRLEELCRELSKEAGRTFSVSEVVNGIVERFFEEAGKQEPLGFSKTLAFSLASDKK